MIIIIINNSIVIIIVHDITPYTRRLMSRRTYRFIRYILHGIASDDLVNCHSAIWRGAKHGSETRGPEGREFSHGLSSGVSLRRFSGPGSHRSDPAANIIMSWRGGNAHVCPSPRRFGSQANRANRERRRKSSNIVVVVVVIGVIDFPFASTRLGVPRRGNVATAAWASER